VGLTYVACGQYGTQEVMQKCLQLKIPDGITTHIQAQNMDAANYE
jgi:hypothetical protein